MKSITEEQVREILKLMRDRKMLDVMKLLKELLTSKDELILDEIKKMKNNKIKLCRDCKQEVGRGVCEWFVTHICEEGEEYVCWTCWNSKISQELNEERFCRRILEGILKEKQHE